jgi:two-component system chemotaxis response regulator CheB
VPEHLVVIGGSAGAMSPLREVVAALPADFPAPVLVTLHLAAGARSVLPRLLDSAGPLTARHPRNGEELRAGTILVAPPDRHLVVHGPTALLSRGPRENRHRPAVDALFNSAARWHGPGVVGVVLSGALDDGAAGAAGVAAQDGTVLVQDPEEARISGMPLAAVRAVRRAHVLPARDIAPLLVDLVRGPAANDVPPPSELLRWEDENVDPTNASRPHGMPGPPVALACPECHGGMFEAQTTGGPHYVCHVGHSWSPRSLVQAQKEASEASLYAAAAKLLEEATLLRRIIADAEEVADASSSADLERRAEEAEQQADRIQQMLGRI